MGTLKLNFQVDSVSVQSAKTPVDEIDGIAVAAVAPDTAAQKRDTCKLLGRTATLACVSCPFSSRCKESLFEHYLSSHTSLQQGESRKDVTRDKIRLVMGDEKQPIHYVCIDCGRESTKAERVREHVILAHLKIPSTCHECQEDLKEIRMHVVMRHLPAGATDCEECAELADWENKQLEIKVVWGDLTDDIWNTTDSFGTIHA